MQLRSALLLFAAVAPATAVLLDSGKSVPRRSANSSSLKEPTIADVAKLHRKLETIAVALEGMLSAKEHGSLADAQVAPTMRTFVKELRLALSDTASPSDAATAMKRLRAAQAGVGDLTKALNKQQESLMHEDATEETNLLLGVLMTRRAEPMEKQLEVLTSADFHGLPVSTALLAKHDSKIPLFQQVAAYVDAHGASANMTSAGMKAQQLAKTLAYFEQRVDKLRQEEQAMQARHNKTASELTDLIKNGHAKSAHHFDLIGKRSEREFKKRLAAHKHQTKMMEDVVVAMRHGDTKALDKAREALRSYMDQMQARTGKFLYLLQLGHRLESLDCPFCVAQCIGKCHDAGLPYADCMTQCAAAGQ